MSRLSRSPLSIAEESFLVLCAGPRPLSLSFLELCAALSDSSAAPSQAWTTSGGPGWAGLSWVDDLRDGRLLVVLDELRRWLRLPGRDNRAKNAVWTCLVSRARCDGPAWTVAAVGMALPRLVRLADRLAEGDGQTRHELDAEILTGFLTRLDTVALHGRAIFPALLDAAGQAARVWLRHQRGYQPAAMDARAGSLPPPAPSAHPDLVLAHCVRSGVLTSDEADLIATTRLDRVTLARAAEALNTTTDAVRMRRARAEARLVAALRAGLADSEGHDDPSYRAALAHLPLTPAQERDHTGTRDRSARTPRGTNSARACSETAPRARSYPREPTSTAAPSAARPTDTRARRIGSPAPAAPGPHPSEPQVGRPDSATLPRKAA
jgi:hypothetical protein